MLENRDGGRANFTTVNTPGSIDGMRRSVSVDPVVIIVASGRLKPRAGDVPANVSFIADPCNDRCTRLKTPPAYCCLLCVRASRWRPLRR
jgi:hypothetical protein